MESLATKPTRLAGRLSQCVVCSSPLPLRLPQEGEVGSPWHCAQCETRYLALLDDDCPAELRQNVRREGEISPYAQTPTEAEQDFQRGRKYEPQGNSKIALPAPTGSFAR